MVAGSDRVLYIGTTDGLFEATPNGGTYKTRPLGLEGKGFVRYPIVDAEDPRRLYAGTSLEGMWRSEDGGASWQEMPASGMPPALPGEGGFAASGTCLVVTGDSDAWLVSGGATVARLYHSADRGRSWTVHDTPLRVGSPSAGIFSVAFRDERHGVIAGGDYQQPMLRGRNLAVTNDGGVTWSLSDSASSPAGYRSAVAFVPKSNDAMLVAVGLTGTDLSRDGGSTWARVDSVAYNSVAFAANGAGWAVGPKGRIARWAPR